MSVVDGIKALPNSIKSVCQKSWLGFKAHPWRALMGIIAALAFLPVCKYCSILIIAGMIIWAVRKFT